MCQKPSGGRYRDRRWTYPLSVEVCLELRQAFGDILVVEKPLGDWYRNAVRVAKLHAELGNEEDAALSDRVPKELVGWLRGKQRAGALWIAHGYRGGGIVADKPGVGKTGETLAALAEADLRGPVLIACPKASVRMVWGLSLKRHLPAVPRYLCTGTRAQRQHTLAAFSAAVRAEPDRLAVCVVVAEMMRVIEAPKCIDVDTGNERPKCEGWRRAWSDDEGTPYCSEGHILSSKNKRVVDYQYPELFDAKVLGGGWTGIVLDESHKMLGSLTVVKGNLKGKGIKRLPERAPTVAEGWRRAVSGTPFGRGGRVHGMFGSLNWLWPDEYTSFWRWAGAHFSIEEKQINRRGDTAKKINGLKGITESATDEEILEANERFLATLGPRILRRTKEEIWPELAPKEIYEVPCEMTPGQKRQYLELAKYGEFETKTGAVVANGVLSLRTRERQLANGSVVKAEGTGIHFVGDSGKLEQLFQKLDNRGVLDGEPGFKLVIASEFTEMLNRVEKDLSTARAGYFRIDGSVPDKRRDNIVTSWQATTVSSDVRVLLIQSKAAGISLDLDAADELHMLDEQDNPEDNEQVEDRIHRANNLDHKVRIYYYRTEGTIDYRKAHDVELKRRAQHAVMDGRRGMADLRKIMMELPEELEL